MAATPSAAPVGGGHAPTTSTATELAALIAAGEVSAREVVLAHVAAIEADARQVNAVTRLLAEEALDQAAAADDRRAGGQDIGPFHGVPFTVKESIDVAGVPTTSGVSALAGAIAPEDAAVVARLRAAGAIPLARTNCPDFTLRLHTQSGLFGETRNPSAPDRTPGGSSGGEAAALASHLTPMGLGTDLGGSLRYPAHCCGIAALKPSAGRVPWTDSTMPYDHVPAVQAMAAVGPMARSVADLRRMLDVMAGPDPRDPWTVPAGDQTPAARRVGLVRSVGDRPCDPAVAEAIEGAAGALEARGYEVDEVELPEVGRVVETWATILLTELHQRWPVLRSLAGGEAVRFLELAFERWPPGGTGELVDGYVERRRLARQWAHLQERYPLILGPVSDRPAFEVGYDLRDAGAVGDIFDGAALTLAGNLFGLPSAAVPVGPVGSIGAVQVTGRRFHDADCLDAAACIEDSGGPPTAPAAPGA